MHEPEMYSQPRRLLHKSFNMGLLLLQLLLLRLTQALALLQSYTAAVRCCCCCCHLLLLLMPHLLLRVQWEGQAAASLH